MGRVLQTSALAACEIIAGLSAVLPLHRPLFSLRVPALAQRSEGGLELQVAVRKCSHSRETSIRPQAVGE